MLHCCPASIFTIVRGTIFTTQAPWWRRTCSRRRIVASFSGCLIAASLWGGTSVAHADNSAGVVAPDDDERQAVGDEAMVGDNRVNADAAIDAERVNADDAMEAERSDVPAAEVEGLFEDDNVAPAPIRSVVMRDLDDRPDLPGDPTRFPAGSPYRQLGDYDWALVRRLLRNEGTTPAHDPNGRVICAIQYRPQDIFLPDEPFPLWLNKFHTTTRTATLASATPIDVGDDYDDLLIEDARVELRDPAIYSTVVVVPIESEESECVELYVVTRDLWSLKIGFEPRMSGGVIEFLGISVQETNFLGLNDTIGVDFALEQGSWEIGPIWQADWFMSRNLKVMEQFRLIFDRESGGYEGTTNTFQLAKPLRSSWDRRAWYVNAHHRSGRGRVYDGASIHRVGIRDPYTGALVEVDERWDDLTVTAEAGYTRSYGLRYKHNLTAGIFVDARDASPAPMDDTVPEYILRIFADERLPRSERAIGLHGKWDFYRNKYTYLTNYNSFAVSEAYRMGIASTASVRYSEPGLLADVRYLAGELGVGYLKPLGADAFISAGVVGGLRWSKDGVVDRRLESSLRIVAPQGVAGRFVARVWGRYMAADTSNDRFRLGATTALRGYAGYAAEGPDAWLANIEWRSKPVEILSLFFGLAAFADVGSAWGDAPYETTYGTLGLGLRFFVPQAMARPGSLDIAFPVGNESWRNGMPSPVISLRFGQGFAPVDELNLERMYR